jgi:hypothetical protein
MQKPNRKLLKKNGKKMEKNGKNTRIIEKVKKILALAESDNENEAAVASVKAREMLAEYNLSISDIVFEPESIKATKIEVKSRKNLEPWMWKLLNIVTRSCDCKYFHHSAGKIFFVGVGADHQVASYMFSYLYKTLLKFSLEYEKSQDDYFFLTASERRLIRKSFILGALETISTRLEKSEQDCPVTENALVPVKNSAIENEMPGNIKTVSSRIQSIDPRCYKDGICEGNNILLNKPVEFSNMQERLC